MFGAEEQTRERRRTKECIVSVERKRLTGGGTRLPYTYSPFSKLAHTLAVKTAEPLAGATRMVPESNSSTRVHLNKSRLLDVKLPDRTGQTSGVQPFGTLARAS